MSNVITGLDIGSAYIKGVVVEEKKNGNFSVLTSFKKPNKGFRKGIIFDVEEAITTLRETSVYLQNISKRAVQNVFINTNSEHIKTKVSKGLVTVSRADQEIQQDDVDHALSAARTFKIPPNYTILHNIIREFFVDDIGEITNPTGMLGNRLEVSTLVVEAFKPHLDLMVKSLNNSGIKVTGLVFNPLAASRAVLSKRQKELGVLLVDLGFSTTSFAVYEESMLSYAKSIPLGAGYVTNDIAVALKIPVETAEKLKLEFGRALSSSVNRREMIKMNEFDETSKNEVSKRWLFEIIEARLAEIFDLVDNELKFLGRSLKLPGGVVLVGGGSKIKDIAELVKEEMKLSAKVGYPNLSGFEVIHSEDQNILEDPEFAVAIGLVLEAYGQKSKAVSSKNFFRFLKNLIP